MGSSYIGLLRKPDPNAITISELSSPAIPDSLYFQTDFVLGAGMVIIQPSTSKVLVVHDERRRGWFLPRGRKDVGESLEQAALREAYEESGYRATFLPLYQKHRAPAPEGSDHRKEWLPTTEAIYVQTQYWPPKRRDNGGEYFVHWYVGQIPEDAVHQTGTGMPDEQYYTSHLLDINEALEKLANTSQGNIVRAAWNLWRESLKVAGELKQDAATLKLSE